MALKDQVYVELIAETTKSISNLAKLVIAWGAVYLASKKVYAVLSDLVNEAAEQEKADMKLAAGIRAVGKEGQISAGRLSDYANELQKVTIYEDVATQEAMGLLIQIGNLSEKGVRQIIPLVQDMASALDMDLNTAAMLVAKTLGSDMNALGRYGIQLEKTNSPTEKLAALTKALDERFGGLAVTMGETTVGKLTILQNQFKELKEQLGVELLPTINNVASALLGFLQNLSSFKSAKDILSPLGFQDAISNIDNARTAIEILNKEIRRTEDLLKTQGKYQGPERERLKQLKDRLLMIQQVVPLLDIQAASEKKLHDVVTKQAEATKTQTEAQEKQASVLRMLYGDMEWLHTVQEAAINGANLYAIELRGMGEEYVKIYPAQVQFTDKLKQQDAYLREQRGALDEAAEALKRYEKQAAAAVNAMQPFADAIGMMAIDSKKGWEMFADAAKNAIAMVLEMLAKMAFVKALAAFAELNFAGGALWIAAGVAAMVAAGVVKAMGEGGLVTKPTLALVGERGPEAVVPLNKMGGFGETRIVVHVYGSVLAEEGLARRIGGIVARQRRGY